MLPAGIRASSRRILRRLLAMSPKWLGRRSGCHVRLSHLSLGRRIDGQYPLLFSDSFYLEQLPTALPSGMTPLEHYLKVGAAAGLNPSPLFDTSYYLESNADVAVAAVNPLSHFLQYGALEGRSPIPFHDRDQTQVEREALKLLQKDANNAIAYLYLAAVGSSDAQLNQALMEDPAGAAWDRAMYALVGCIHAAGGEAYLASKFSVLERLTVNYYGTEKELILYRILVQLAAVLENRTYISIAINLYELASNSVFAEASIHDRLSALKEFHINSVFEAGEAAESRRLCDLWKNERSTGHLVQAGVVSAKSYTAESGDPYKELRPERPISPPNLQFLDRSFQPTAEQGDLTAPPQYLAFIKGALTFSRCNTLLVESTAIHDAATHRRGGDIVFGDTCPPNRALVRARYGNNLLIELPNVEEVSRPTGLMMFGVHSQNYGHWLLEFLPRMLVFDTDLCPETIPIYVDEGMPDTHIEALELLNSLNRDILRIPSGKPIRFGELGIVPVPAFFPFDIISGKNAYDTIWPSDIFSELKSKIISAVDMRRPVSDRRRRRLFISRKSFSSRQLLNENEISAYLETIGFETIYPEQMTFVEQVLTFRDAEIVVGSCNSALSNCLFCDSDCLVIGLIHGLQTFNFGGYSSFLKAGGVDILFVQGRGNFNDDIHPFHASYSVDIHQIQLALLRMLSGTATLSPQLSDMRLLVRQSMLTPLFDVDYMFRQGSPDGCTPNRYLAQGAAAKCDPNPLFDETYYRCQLTVKLAPPMTALEHYLLEGAANGLNPSVLFDTCFYLESNADVAASGMNPLVHFLTFGLAEGRLPIPLDAVSIEAVRSAISALLLGLPKSQLAQAYQSYVYWSDNKFSDAIALMSRLVKKAKRGTLSNALNSVIQRMVAEGRIKESIEACRALLAVDKENVACRHILAYSLRDAGYLEDAEVEFYSLLSAAPREANSLVWEAAWKDLNSERTEMTKLCYEASCSLSRGEHERALELATLIEAIRPLTPGLDELTMRASAEVGKLIPGSQDAASKRGTPKLLLLDTSYPSNVSSFRYGEFTTYLREISESKIYSSLWGLREFGERGSFFELSQAVYRSTGIDPGNIKSFHATRPFEASLVYTVFLNNAFWYWNNRNPQRRTPFGFTLYPGGGFNLHDSRSDRKIRKLCDDADLKFIITTQNITYRYLVERGFCEPARILHIFGGIVPTCWELNNASLTREYGDGIDRPFNICFVAQRYSPQGVEKGYDVFALLVKAFANDPRVKFHVVGGWTRDINGLHSVQNVTFYGKQSASFFSEFYRRMDAIISPNISGLEKDGGVGSFDGFPTTTCVEAGIQGVAMFLSDSLGQNATLNGSPILVAGVDFELIDRNVEHLISTMDQYFANPERFRSLGNAGRAALLRVFSFENQMKPRMNLLNSIVLKEDRAH